MNSFYLRLKTFTNPLLHDKPHPHASSFFFYQRCPEGRMMKHNGRENTIIESIKLAWMCYSCRKQCRYLHIMSTSRLKLSQRARPLSPSFLTALGAKMDENIQQPDNEHPNSQTWAIKPGTIYTHPLHTYLRLPVVMKLQVHYECSEILVFSTCYCTTCWLLNYTLDWENADGRNLKTRKLRNYPDGKGDNLLWRSEERSQAEQNICCL